MSAIDVTDFVRAVCMHVFIETGVPINPKNLSEITLTPAGMTVKHYPVNANGKPFVGADGKVTTASIVLPTKYTP